MSVAAEEEGLDAPRTPPRSIRLADLPRQHLDQGRGSAREIWADLDHDLNLRWQLRVIDIKDSTGLLVGPAGTHHYVVGVAGPQVAVRHAETSRVLRRDQVMPVLSSRVHFERPKLRPPGVSSLMVLTFAGTAEPPVFVTGTVAVDAELRVGAQLLVALRGTVHLDGVEADPGSALLLDPTRAHQLRASSASILTVNLPRGDEPPPG